MSSTDTSDPRGIRQRHEQAEDRRQDRQVGGRQPGHREEGKPARRLRQSRREIRLPSAANSRNENSTTATA